LEQQRARDIWVIKQICKLSEVASLPVIIWFDQAEGWGSDYETGDSHAEAIARSIDRLYFDCNNVLLLICLHNDEWQQIEKMRGGIPDRVGQIVLDAKPPTADQMIELVRMRLNWFYTNKKLNPNDYPHLYPLEEPQIRSIARSGAGVRQLLDKCADIFEKTESINSIEKRKKQIIDNYNELINKKSFPIIRGDEKIAAIIACAMKMVPTSGMANVVIHEIRDISLSSSHDLHLVIIGYDSSQQKDVHIGIRICETTSARTFNAVMKHLIDYEKYKITRGCLVRSTPVPLSWRVGQRLKQKLVNQQGGEVVVLNKEDIKPLAALERIYEQSADYGFEKKEELVSLVQELGLVARNSLIREILSVPVTV
jgi:ribosomal protein L32E